MPMSTARPAVHPVLRALCRGRAPLSRAGVCCGMLAVCVAVAAGCVRREIEITSSPAGAQVLLNGRDVGRTPTRIEFTFDGTYDVRLRLDGYDPVVGSGTTQAPVWDFIGADLIAEVYPADLHRLDQWHFDLVPEADAEVGLLERAEAMRATQAAQPAAAPGAPAPKGAPTPATAPPVAAPQPAAPPASAVPQNPC